MLLLRTSTAQLAALGLVLALVAFAPQDAPKDAPQAAPWKLEKPAPALGKGPEKLDRLENYNCAKCHAEVVAEWSETLHALAWVDPLYVEELKDRKRQETCWGCHIPKPLLQDQLGVRPDPREPERHFGIMCESCHLGATGEMFGPRGTPTTAHASKQHPAMVGAGSNALCATCHRVNVGPVIGIAKDFETSNQEARGRTCVGCHMAEVERQWANAPASGAKEAEAPMRKGRSHALQTPRDPAFLKRAFVLSLSNASGKSVVTIHNDAGHRVPGLIGRAIAFQAKLLDDKGATLAEQKLEFTTRSFLPVDGDVQIAFEQAGAKVALIGIHHDPRRDEPVTFLEQTLEP